MAILADHQQSEAGWYGTIHVAIEQVQCLHVSHLHRRNERTRHTGPKPKGLASWSMDGCITNQRPIQALIGSE
jgi:hypothetical protein